MNFGSVFSCGLGLERFFIALSLLELSTRSLFLKGVRCGFGLVLGVEVGNVEVEFFFSYGDESDLSFVFLVGHVFFEVVAHVRGGAVFVIGAFIFAV